MRSSGKRITSIALAFLLCTALGWGLAPVERASAANTTYYIDNAGGNDTNAGTSAGSAWRTLSKANSVVLQPGDKLLFKAGGVWTGTLQPQGSGSASNPIEIGRYGTGPDPVINGNGASYAVF